jgi:2-polyprenyl-3-methyl-5-hydroxy-6-metoxy-1,4-benzoquinol methylase
MKNVIYIPCPICNTSDFKNLYKLNGWQLVQCSFCDFVYVNPRPLVDVIEHNYNLDNFEKESFNLADGHKSYYDNGHDQDTRHINKTIQRLLKLRKSTTAACKLMDFGCGDGTFLKQALEAGIEGYGYDIGNWNTEALQQKELASHVFLGNFDDALYENESFDIIYSSAVFEHLYYPQRMIEQLKQKLKPNGILALMSIPNLDSIFIRLGIESFDGNVPLVHLNFFSRKTLSFFLCKNDFHPIYNKAWGVPLRLSCFSKSKYYQSNEELGMEGWHDAIIQSHTSNLLQRLHVYGFIKKSVNSILNIINGGAVIDMIAYKR